MDRLFIGAMQAHDAVRPGQRRPPARPRRPVLRRPCGRRLLFAYQQWLIRDRERGPCFKAFLNNNFFGLVVFAGLVADLLAHRL